MIRRPAIYLFVAALALVTPAAAQTPLTLTEAIVRARAQNPDAGSTAAAEGEAAQRVTQARAGYWPRVDVAESWQRGNQPVFVFSSLLAQRQFTTADFALGALNHPDAVDNFRSAVTVEQSLFDRATRANVAAAGLGHALATANRMMVDHDLAVRVTNEKSSHGTKPITWLSRTLSWMPHCCPQKQQWAFTSRSGSTLVDRCRPVMFETCGPNRSMILSSSAGSVAIVKRLRVSFYVFGKTTPGVFFCQSAPCARPKSARRHFGQTCW